MKKNFILLSTFAALMVSAILLTACGDDVQTPEKVGTEQETNTEEITASTIFSTGDDGTRTSMDTERRFYWSEGDQIYVNTTGDTYQKTSKSTLYDNDTKADFVLNGIALIEPKCSVMYIGNGTTTATADASALKVKIEATQTQSQWGNSDHLGASGDCGFAEATKNPATGKYSFSLTHKASYLVLQPYKPTSNTNDWKLMKIEIIANGTTTLAGKYPFGTGELNVSGATNTANTVTLLCNGNGSTTGGFALGTSASAANSIFAVIQPDSHELTIRYTVKVYGKENVYLLGTHGGDFGTMFFEKKIATRPYNPNGVTTIKHELFFAPLYYQWGATDTYFNTYQTNAYDQTTMAPTQLADPLWNELPNANEMYSYLAYGDPRWDGTTLWSCDGGLTEYTGGAWLKKRSAIGSQFSDVVGLDGFDMRSVERAYSVNGATYRTGGKPVSTVIDQYFLLPALGFYYNGFHYFGSGDCLYWSKSPYPDADGNRSYYLAFDSTAGWVLNNKREFGFCVTPNWFK